MPEEIQAETPTSEEVKEEEVLVEFTSRDEYITCACNALSAALTYRETLDEIMTAKSTVDRLKRIERKSLAILDELVGEMYDELFDKDEE